MPGDQEHIVKLNADHGGLCKFGLGQTDQDNFKLVRGNIKDLYEKALRRCKWILVFSFLVRNEETLMLIAYGYFWKILHAVNQKSLKLTYPATRNVMTMMMTMTLTMTMTGKGKEASALLSATNVCTSWWLANRGGDWADYQTLGHGHGHYASDPHCFKCKFLQASMYWVLAEHPQAVNMATMPTKPIALNVNQTWLLHTRSLLNIRRRRIWPLCQRAPLL